MQETSFEGRFTKRSRPLVHALIISVALNLGLLATFMTFILREKKIETLLQVKASLKSAQRIKSISQSNAEVLEEYEQASFANLLLELENEELLEQGYSRRDLALACLVAYHHFDLQRALPGIEVQKRSFAYTNSEKVIDLMPGLDQERFQVISYFARTEMWPLTAQGLFEEMRHRRQEIPESLRESFFLSKEFYQVERAFNRLPFVFTRDTLLHLLLDGNWELIKQVSREIELHPRGEIEQIGAFLAGFKSSKLAAYLLVALDPNYPYTQFSDEQLHHFIGLLDQQTEEAAVFLNRVATSVRSDSMRQMAVEKVSAWGKKVTYTSKDKEYVVKKGDSLWSLSRQFDISVERIRALNDLESDVLNPGQVLRIPHVLRNLDGGE